jgi:hypothetical protein
MLASLSTLTGYTFKSFIPGTPSKPPANHSVVRANNKNIPLPPPRKDEVILQLPAGSKIKEIIPLKDGKSIEWEFKVGRGGAKVSGDWGQ